jgi:plastocyanin
MMFHSRSSRSRAGRAWLAVAALLVVPVGASAEGTISGTIELPLVQSPTRPVTNPYPGRATEMRTPDAVSHGDVRDVVVYADITGAFANQLQMPPPERLRMFQHDQAFVPRVLAVPVGAVVEFPNDDPVLHEVMSLSKIARFDLGRRARGDNPSMIFSKPGIATVFCDIHPGSEGYVLVLPHQVVARPDENGHFQLPPLPPGDYTIRAWHPDFDEVSELVQIPRQGDATLSLRFKP